MDAPRHTLTTREELAAAREAFERHDWPDARARYARLDEAGALDAEDLERYAESVWWLARLEEAIGIRERAYALHLKAGARVQAARVALWLVIDYVSRLRHTLAAGAMDRAQRLLADEPPGLAHAHLAALEALLAGEQGHLEEAAAKAEEAAGLAARFGDPDIESLALLTQGEVLVARGHIQEGLALVDRATSAAVGGELSPFATGIVYCGTISACRDLGDYGRAAEWTEAAERWCHQQAMPGGFPGICRVHRAEVKRVSGDWSQAEEEARRAAEELQESFLDTAGAAHNEIGEIRLLLGDLDGAEAAFRDAHSLGHQAQPGLALLRLARGRPDAAMASIRTALSDQVIHPFTRLRLLPAKVEIAVAAGDVEAAAGAADELAALSGQYEIESPVLRAKAATASARVALARGDAPEALGLLQRASRGWQQLRMPYDMARTRVLLAEAHRLLGDEETARLELESARVTFERLGARLDREAVERLLSDKPSPETVTTALLFTDIVTSTDLIELIGDAAWTDLVHWHDQTLRELFALHGGVEVNHTGDGFFVAFPSADQAMACAVAIQQHLRDHRRDHGFAPPVRIGVHVDAVLHDAGEFHGKGVHVAARIAALAEGGQILASQAAVDAAGDVPHAGARAVELRGVTDPVTVVEVAWGT